MSHHNRQGRVQVHLCYTTVNMQTHELCDPGTEREFSLECSYFDTFVSIQVMHRVQQGKQREAREEAAEAVGVNLISLRRRKPPPAPAPLPIMRLFTSGDSLETLNNVKCVSRR